MRKPGVTAVVPVRSGSQRVPNKNLRPFGQSSLLEEKLKLLKTVRGIDRLVVSSDSEEMLAVAERLGVETHRRSDYHASSNVPNYEFWTNLAEEIVDTEYFMLANCVAPFIRRESYESMIDHLGVDGCDSVASVEAVRDFIWDNRTKTAVNYDGSKAPNSQDLPDLVKLTFGVCLLKTDDLIRKSNILGDSPYFYRLSQLEALDIDTPFDFEVARRLYDAGVREEADLK